MSRHLLLLWLALLAPLDRAVAAPGSPGMCPGGRFVAREALVVGDGAGEARAVVLSTGQVSLGGTCAATAATVTRTRHGTLVRARWQACDGVSGPVRLRATMRGACGTLSGIVHARHRQRRFIATREPQCGNGIREDTEQCDRVGCCTGDCRWSTDPGCPGLPPCTTDVDCAGGSVSGAFCSRLPGQCAGAGVCESGSNVACSALFDPVCGCDGKTYGNSCEAFVHRVDVASRGACGSKHCGTIVGLPCDEGQFCEFSPGECDVADADGSCVPVPDVCPGTLDPVCGCDGQTYVNDCQRRQAGVQKAHDHRCRHCLDLMCSPESRPVDTDGDGCPDACVPIGCTPPPCAAVFVPVDTDGDGCADTCASPCRQTCDCYTTRGLEFAHQCPLECASCGEFWSCEDGACREHCGPVPPGNEQCEVPPGFCATNDDCAPDQYCACGLAMCGGSGICVVRPTVCTREFAPVCGCDGKTYDTACVAAGAGVRVASVGACEGCHDITCPDGSHGIDTDNDGCTDTCQQSCQTACDCGALPIAQTGVLCPLAALCPAPLCGSFWTCEKGICVAHCGVVPADGTCPVP